MSVLIKKQISPSDLAIITDTGVLYQYQNEKETEKKGTIIPFSYYFHHHLTTPRIDFPVESREFDFTGFLRREQQAYLPDIFKVLYPTRSVILSFHCGFGKTII